MRGSFSVPVRVGVVGIGYGQQVHVPALRRDPRAIVAAVCASSEERAQRVADKLGIPRAFGDWRALLDDPEIDAVTIATPPAIQPQIAATALARGKAVFAEKPLAAGLAEARGLAAAAAAAGLPNVLDLEFREIPEWRRARELLRDGTIGALRHVVLSWQVETYANRNRLDSWKSRAAEGGGTLFGFVSHALYNIEWLAGPIAGLTARMHRSHDDHRPGDTFAALLLELESGAAAALAVSADAFAGSGHRIELYGEEGTLVLHNPTRDYVRGFRLLCGTRGSGELQPVDTAQDDGTEPDGRIVATGRLMSRFLDWATTGAPQRPDFADGVRVQALLDAARTAHESGAWIAAPEMEASRGSG